MWVLLPVLSCKIVPGRTFECRGIQATYCARRSTTPALAQYCACFPCPAWFRNSSVVSEALLYHAICILFISLYRFSISSFIPVITTTTYSPVTHRPTASSDTFSYIPFRISTSFSDISPGMCLSTEISKGSRCPRNSNRISVPHCRNIKDGQLKTVLTHLFPEN